VSNNLQEVLGFVVLKAFENIIMITKKCLLLMTFPAILHGANFTFFKQSMTLQGISKAFLFARPLVYQS